MSIAKGMTRLSPMGGVIVGERVAEDTIEHAESTAAYLFRASGSGGIVACLKI
jgi:hypothetical protein